MNKLTAQIASLPDRDNVVYEIYFGTDQVAEISNEPDMGLRIEIFAASANGSWNFDFNEFRALVEQAERNIT